MFEMLKQTFSLPGLKAHAKQSPDPFVCNGGKMIGRKPLATFYRRFKGELSLDGSKRDESATIRFRTKACANRCQEAAISFGSLWLLTRQLQTACVRCLAHEAGQLVVVAGVGRAFL